MRKHSNISHVSTEKLNYNASHEHYGSSPKHRNTWETTIEHLMLTLFRMSSTSPTYTEGNKYNKISHIFTDKRDYNILYKHWHKRIKHLTWTMTDATITSHDHWLPYFWPAGSTLSEAWRSQQKPRPRRSSHTAVFYCALGSGCEPSPLPRNSSSSLPNLDLSCHCRAWPCSSSETVHRGPEWTH